MFGLLNIDKPFDVTSRDVVNQLQRLVRPHKVGHAGTLDPLATGVLVICVGKATRLNEYMQRFPKTYRGTFLLGRQSDTEDTEGEVVELERAPRPDRAAVEQALGQFRGHIMQRPPAFSALKVKGQRAYALARRGRDVQLEPRPVTIHQLTLLRYDYPELELEVSCSSGTYIRSLGRDIGESLGSAAVMSALRRTAIGPFRIEQSCSLDELTAANVADNLLPPLLAVVDLPRRTLSDAEQNEMQFGRTIDGQLPSGATQLAALDARGALVAVLVAAPQGGLKPHRYFGA